MSPPSQKYVEHDEFERFASGVTREFDKLADKLDRMARDYSTSNRTNWAAVGVGVTIVGLAAALAGYAIASESDARKQADVSQTEYFDLAVDLRRETIDANRARVESEYAAEIRRISEHIGENRDRFDRLVDEMQREDYEIRAMMDRRIAESADTVRREIALHIERIGNLVAVNTMDLNRIQAGRFDAGDGRRLEGRVDRLEEAGR